MPDETQHESAEAAEVRNQAREWIRGNWDEDMSLLSWRRLLMEARWAVPSYPEEWFGRGLPRWADVVVAEELGRAGAVGLPLGPGPGLAAPTILAHGSEHVLDRFLAPILTGEEIWCQLFSEPSAGSDLAGLTTRARLDGDHWVVSGQKVWNTSADHADFGLILARTDVDVPKHQGITYFVLPMKQPGVEVRPLMQMNEYSSFNEVFLSEARIPVENVVGREGDGWSVARTTLSYERRFGSMPRPDYGDRKGLALEEARLEAERHFSTYRWYPQRSGRVDLIVDHLRNSTKNADPVVRQEVAKLLSMHRASGWFAERVRLAMQRGQRPSAESSLGKLANSEIARQASKVHAMLAGSATMLAGTESRYDGTIAEVLLSTPAQSIAGGTDQIQRNIVGEALLGLPREPSVDTKVPFKDTTRG